jgi:uncharacterized protein with HEPN domain
MKSQDLVRVKHMIEAASKISEDFKLHHPEIPWALIIGMRNKLIHAYFDINLDILWRTVTVNLPLLKEQLDTILEPSTE